MIIDSKANLLEQTAKKQYLLELINIYKAYNVGKENEFVALKDINLQVSYGEFLAIMGPSGSGKSSLMNLLGALDTPTKGDYLVHGKNVNTLNNSNLADFRNKEVGFVFQQFNLLSKLSVKENIMLPSLYGKVINKENRAKELLEKVKLSTKAKNKPNQLSGGEQQRVAIARALFMNPSIIMADEPTGNLDTKTANQIMDLIKEIHSEGNTIILITHEESIAEMAQRTINIKDGMIIN